MKKILFVISTLTGGGAERVLSNLTLGLPENIEIDILVNSTSLEDYEVRGNVISLGMLPQKHKTLFYQIRAFIRRLVVIRRLKKNNGYIACISFLDSANIANVLTGKKHCKTILTIHNSLSDAKSKAYRYIVCPMVKLLYNYSSKVVCVSEGVAKELIYDFGIKENKIKVIYNGFPEQTQNLVNVERTGFELATMGRLEYYKGHLHLLRAFSKVVEMQPKARLHIMGEGPLELQLTEFVKRLRIQQNVVFHGFVKETRKVLNEMDIFVFSSISEGFGNVLIEAMQMGIPVVSTNYRHGAREILGNKRNDYNIKENFEITTCGILVPVFQDTKDFNKTELEPEEQIMAQAILFLMSDNLLRKELSINGLKRSEDFSMQNIVKKWIQVIEE